MQPYKQTSAKYKAKHYKAELRHAEEIVSSPGIRVEGEEQRRIDIAAEADDNFETKEDGDNADYLKVNGDDPTGMVSYEFLNSRYRVEHRVSFIAVSLRD
jgi:hypothetical protein